MGIAISSRENETMDSTIEPFDFDIPEDILVQILSFVPALDLLNNCVVVCKQWHNLISGHGIWKRKCEREKKPVILPSLQTIPLHYYRIVYMHNPFGKNLIENPFGEQQLSRWEIISSGGNGWKIENPPGGADPVPEEVGSLSCFATSYQECTKSQIIYLHGVGVHRDIMDSVQPPIEVGEWHAARFDCSSTYKLKVSLLDGNQKELSKFEKTFSTEQWLGREWNHVHHTFKDYPSGARYIRFIHTGHDDQFWAGHYGSKMTGSYIKFKVP